MTVNAGCVAKILLRGFGENACYFGRKWGCRIVIEVKQGSARKLFTTILTVSELLANPPAITLTTDFGSADHYVGTMKGVILRTCPQAQIIDITHDVPPYSLYGGAYAIAQAAPYFPDGTVHTVVVDPGVGTARRAMVLEADDQYFVAPDNGVLTLVMEEEPNVRAFEIIRRDLMLPVLSTTFHGRDIFAPIAAAIAQGLIKPEELGPPISDPTMMTDLAPQQIRRDWWNGRILSIDRFGNVITNFRLENTAILTKRFRMEIGNFYVEDFQTTFAHAPAGVLFAYLGSSNYIEVGLNRESAAAWVGAEVGQSISLHY